MTICTEFLDGSGQNIPKRWRTAVSHAKTGQRKTLYPVLKLKAALWIRVFGGKTIPRTIHKKKFFFAYAQKNNLIF
jgi:hypothetical protein